MNLRELANSYSEEKLPCGLGGTIDERVSDCSIRIEGFVLVTRSTELKEVWKQLSTGLLFSDRVNMQSHQYAVNSCERFDGEIVGFPHFSWRLPSIYEFIEADKDGIRDALPNMWDHYFWSSTTLFQNNKSYAAVFEGYRGHVVYNWAHDTGGSVRRRWDFLESDELHCS